MIQRLVKFRTLHSLVLEDLVVCESYIEGKMTNKHFTVEEVSVKEWLKFMHTNMCRRFNV